MNRIEKKFKELKKLKKKAFIAFITAGYPNLKTTEQLVLEFSRIGVDIVELGVPFSDPIADGPIIQVASQAALKNKVYLKDILALVKKVRRVCSIPICLMTYYNPIFCFGEGRFVKAAVASGVDGVIVPDLPPDEAKAFMRQAAKNKLDVICFISPTTCLQRIKYITRHAKGFIYYVSLTGVTGPKEVLPADLIRNIKMVKRYTQKPVCVGFGIARPQQVRQLNRYSDGVIVGSAIVGKIKENIGKKGLVRKVGQFTEYLKNV
jgi:tryptophan synthase alpha chain